MEQILCIDTSGSTCLVAISINGILKEQILNPGPNDHAANLHSSIRKLVADMSNLSAVAVSSGPGSYTGLRIGVSAAKGLCYGTGIPLIALPTLELLAHSALKLVKTDGVDYLIPMIDARRDEVYTSVYGNTGCELQQAKAMILNDKSYSDWLGKGRCCFIGSGAAKLSSFVNHHNLIDQSGLVEVNAEAMTKLAYQRFLEKRFEDVAYFEPSYLKPFFFTSKKA